jgi:hypothetical protein
MRNVMRVGAVGLVLSLSSGCAPAQVSAPPAAAVYTPLVIGWEQFFRITWEPFQRRRRPYVGGYVLNNWGLFATRVQLLVDGLDASGRVTSQSVAWLGSSVPPGSRVYFEVPAPQPAATYRVSVFAFDWLQSAQLQTP